MVPTYLSTLGKYEDGAQSGAVGIISLQAFRYKVLQARYIQGIKN